MKKNNAIRKVKHIKSKRQCSVHEHIAAFAADLDRQANATEIIRDKRKSVPVQMLDMVF